MVLNFAHFWGTLKLGVKQGLEAQIRDQSQVNFKDNLNVQSLYKVLNAGFNWKILRIEQGTSIVDSQT